MPEEKKKSNIRNVIQVDNELLDDISSLIETGTAESLLNILANLHPADIGEIINHLRVDEAVYLFGILDNETAGEVIVELDESLREQIFSETDASKITDIVDEMEIDDATDIVAELPDNIAEHVLDNMDEESSEDLKEYLKYPDDSAGGIMNSDYIAMQDNLTIKDAIEEIRKNSEEYDNIYQIYVVKPDDELIGTVLIKSLLVHTPETKLVSLIEGNQIYVTPDVDQEKVANIMERYDLVAIPVVDENKKLLGRITIDDIVDVINEEAAEDIQKIAGLSEEEETNYSAYRVSSIRLPWLLVALIGELISASVLSSFQATIKQIYIAGVFIPIVMAMGGSSGTQSAIVVVRGLATGDIWLSETTKRLIKEFKVSLLNGLACAIVLLIATQLFWKEALRFSLILSGSLIIIMVNATMIGALIPIVLKKIKLDPAISTGPFVTTANDVIGLLIYFTLISLFYTA